MASTTPHGPPHQPSLRDHYRLATLFAVIYFVQGISEPGEGLISQPLKSLLRDWGQSTGETSLFMMLVGLPWSIKWVFGICTDFVPLFGYRRRSYMLAASGAGAVGFLALYFMPLGPTSVWLLLGLLLLPSIGVAFCDVVTDALMVEHGQPHGITGKLQSIQWAAIYTATIFTGTIGGYFSQAGRQQESFFLCGAAVLVAFVLALLWVREPHCDTRPQTARDALRALWRAARTPQLIGVAGFIFLWNFNPFSSTVLYRYMTDELHFGEQFYGNMVSCSAIASVVACVAFGFYCRRVSTRGLIHISIATGVFSTLAYVAMVNKPSAGLIFVATGAATMTATLIQLDLAARVCPPESAGTVFSFIMGLSNFSTSISQWLGGSLYDYLQEWLGTASRAFNVLVVCGALLTACCWLMVPYLRRHSFGAEPEDASPANLP